MNFRMLLMEILPFAAVCTAIIFAGVVFGVSYSLFWGVAAAFATACVFLLIDFARLFWLARWLDNPSLVEIPEPGPLDSWHWVCDRLRVNQLLFEKNSKKLKSRETRYRRILSALPDGVVLLKTGWTIDWCNESAERLLGVEPDFDHGRPATEVFTDRAITSYLEAGDFSRELKFTSERRRLSLEIRVIVLGRKNFVLIAHDITERERLDAVKRDFVANVQHELRTPLTVVNGFLELAEPGATEREVVMDREHYNLMRTQSQRMAGLVADLLTLSRLERGSVAVSDTVIDMEGLILKVVEVSSALSSGRHEITWSAAMAGLRGNEAEVQSALSNLVSNAVRYTPEHGHIRIDWRDDSEGMVLSVTDDGIGIEAKDIPRLTERFYRVDKSRSRDTGGTGLGLAIVKHVMIRHGGRLAIKSQPGCGSVFAMVFPPDRIVS